MKTKRRTFKTSFVTLTVVLLLPILCSLIKVPEREIEARTRPVIHGLRGNILDRTGTLLAFSQVDDRGGHKRIYPYEDLARAIIGETDPLGRGLSGIELALDEGLSKGMDVFLTLEREVQIRASDLLALQIRRFRASYGCMIVMDVGSGDVLALASKGRDVKAKGDIQPAPYEERLFYAGGIILPLRWLLKGDLDPSEVHKSIKRPGWLSVEQGRYLVWSPWGEEFIIEQSENRSYTRELIGLGLGKAPDKIPLYVTEVFDGEFRATPLHLLQAFSRLITGNSVSTPRFVMKKPPATSLGEAPRGQDDPVECQDAQKNRARALLQALSKFTVPALATVWWDSKVEGKTRRTCEIMALGYWPQESPRVVYITALKGALKDPRKVPGYLSRAKRVLEAANLVPIKGVSLAASSR